MRLVQMGEFAYFRVLFLLSGAIGLSLFLRIIVARLIHSSPLYEFAKEGTYFLSMVVGIVVNHFWVEALQTEKQEIANESTP